MFNKGVPLIIMSSTRSGRTVHVTKRYRPDALPRGVEEPAVEEEEEDAPVRRVRSTIRSLPDVLAAASKAQHDTLMAMLKEMQTHTNLLKRSVRILSETLEATLDIHEGLAIVAKDAVPKEEILVPTLPLE